MFRFYNDGNYKALMLRLPFGWRFQIHNKPRFILPRINIKKCYFGRDFILNWGPFFLCRFAADAIVGDD